MRLRLPHLPRELLLVVAALCILLGILLALVAVDVARWHSTIRADDVRFTAGAPPTGWKPATLAPFRAGERTLAVRDDVAALGCAAAFMEGYGALSRWERERLEFYGLFHALRRYALALTLVPNELALCRMRLAETLKQQPAF